MLLLFLFQLCLQRYDNLALLVVEHKNKVAKRWWAVQNKGYICSIVKFSLQNRAKLNNNKTRILYC